MRGIFSMLMVDSRYGKGAYMSFKDRLSITATGKSRPNETPARRPERKVNRGGWVGVEKKRRCRWKAVYVLRDMF